MTSEDERMQQVLDSDEYQRANETRFADFLHVNDISSPSTTSDGGPISEAGIVSQRPRWREGPNVATGKFYDWPDSESRGNYRRVHDDMPGANSEQTNGILSFIAANCLPGSTKHIHMSATKDDTRKKKSYLPCLLGGLIIYGLASMIIDLANSFSYLQKLRATNYLQGGDRFPGGFVIVSGQSAGSSIDQRDVDSSTKMSMLQTRSFDLSREVDELVQPPSGTIDKNNPTMADVPHLTEQILSNTFQHVLEYSKNDLTYENEVPFFWTFGTTADHMFMSMLQCFPNVVQASGGNILGNAAEEAMRKFPNDIKVLQRQKVLGDAATMNVNGGKYLNVDLFTSEGVKRAANLNLLFPSMQYPLIREHDYSDVTPLASDQTNADTSDLDAKYEDASFTAAKQQIQLLVSPFLTEVTNGLFSPTNNNAPHPPQAKVHSIMLPTSHRIRSYHQMYISSGGTGTFLEFITSPSIIVNNYVTRILSGQWNEEFPVTEVHLEIAKNIISRKIHMWPNRGVQDMVSYWANMYGWQGGAMEYRDQILQQIRQQQQAVPENELLYGLECVFPPPDPDLPPPLRSTPQEPTDLEKEINRILNERNGLDDQLFLYVVQLYDSWMA